MASIALLTACSNDDNDALNQPINNEGQSSVNFELDASILKYSGSGSNTLRYSPTYDKDGFSVYAFRQVYGGTDYVFEKEINLANMTYRESDKKLVGNDLLNIGTYKFISAYGLKQSGILTLPTWGTLSDNYSFSYNGGTTSLGEIFLQDTDVANLTSYDLGINATNETVTATLNRAVSRVDIMFFKGRKNADGSYTELPYNAGNNVFGNKTIERVQLSYGNLNNVMGMFGQYLTTSPMTANIELNNFSEIITIGDAAATIVGEDNYTRFDDVQTSDIIYGGSHIFGNYLFPNTSDVKNTPLQVFIKPVGGIGRTINVSVDEDHLLPLEKNKVTLVKIYVLDSGTPPGPGPDPEEPTVFTTNVKFEIEIETVWAGSHEVEGEIN